MRRLGTAFAIFGPEGSVLPAQAGGLGKGRTPGNAALEGPFNPNGPYRAGSAVARLVSQAFGLGWQNGPFGAEDTTCGSFLLNAFSIAEGRGR